MEVSYNDDEGGDMGGSTQEHSVPIANDTGNQGRSVDGQSR